MPLVLIEIRETTTYSKYVEMPQGTFNRLSKKYDETLFRDRTQFVEELDEKYKVCRAENWTDARNPELETFEEQEDDE